MRGGYFSLICFDIKYRHARYWMDEDWSIYSTRKDVSLEVRNKSI